MEFWFNDMHTQNVQLSIRVEKQLFSGESDFQRIDVFDSPEFGRFLASDGSVIFSEKDEFTYDEMIVHVPMAVHPNVKRVLVIGGGDGGVARELTHYEEIEAIDVVEQDKLFVDVCRKYFPANACGLDGVVCSSREAAVLTRGHEPVSFTLTPREGNPIWVGLSVCYDLRFPELYRLLAADLILVPAAFTHTTGQAHWEVLLRARAIENQAYVLASAQGGEHSNGRRTWGHSLAIDPWGQVLACQAHGEGVVLATLDTALQQQVRSNLPALQHRVF